MGLIRYPYLRTPEPIPTKFGLWMFFYHAPLIHSIQIAKMPKKFLQGHYFWSLCTLSVRWCTPDRMVIYTISRTACNAKGLLSQNEIPLIVLGPLLHSLVHSTSKIKTYMWTKELQDFPFEKKQNKTKQFLHRVISLLS